MKRGFFLTIAAICLGFVTTAAQQPLAVHLDKPGAAIPPTMWGIFFEDINMAADGGLYAEMIKNRSFEFSIPLMGWEEKKEGGATGSLLIENRGMQKQANPRYLRVGVNSAGGSYGISNEGFRGMGVMEDSLYNFSLWASAHNNTAVTLRIQLVNAKGQKIGETTISPAGMTWKKYAASIRATATDAKASLIVWFEGKGTIDIDMVSLFPAYTWKHRPGGLRADLVQMLADLKPGFIRFPGGCIVEGRDLANRYQWKKTVGNVEDRQLIINRWNTEFSYRSTPDYFQSFGLGFYEYFQLAEDIGASPLPILNCGMACQFNTAEVVPADQLDPYIQDALDLIEFANGATTTKWGGLRAAMGHPAPFNLKMMGVGNEQWGPQYVERYKIFTAAIKAKYPGIKLINSVGPFSGGEMFNYLNDTLRKMHADFLDEHYYAPPEWFLHNAGRYDKYDRNGPKIFAGEYAAHTRLTDSGILKNNWQSALAEAAFMTGLERNADVVNMASYAPLFANADAWQWAPDLIWFNSLAAYGTPNYYVQKLFSNNKGTRVVTVTAGGKAPEGADSLYATACMDEPAGVLIVKLVNVSASGKQQDLVLEGLNNIPAKATELVLQQDDLAAVNSFADKKHVSPVESIIDAGSKTIHLVLKPRSLTILKLKTR
ncbi:MAG TPA: alpha-L-arabinofuranosidase C-terminal domain-containing protein [Chitinophagaceae bacterium]|nr:alpha-L-arabinofuranosidase C-terminal domain-containing protein [Chitinophagaceae bacterium]